MENLKMYEKLSLGFSWTPFLELEKNDLFPFEDRSVALETFVRDIPFYVSATLKTFENISTSDLDAKIIFDYEHSVSDLQMSRLWTVENYGIASRLLFEYLKRQEEPDIEITQGFLCRLHRILARDEVKSCGSLRNIPVRIHDSTYIPPHPRQVAQILQQGLDFLNSFVEDDSGLSLHERAFATFLFIARTQPFENANKRTAGLAMNAILVSNGYPSIAFDESPSYFLEAMADFYETGEADTVMSLLYNQATRQQDFYFSRDEEDTDLKYNEPELLI